MSLDLELVAFSMTSPGRASSLKRTICSSGRWMERSTTGWVLMVNPMPQESPDCLICTNIASIQVLLDIIRGFAKLHGSAVMALVYIFVDILDAPYSKGQLHIDVTYKEKEEGHMGNHPLVVKLGTT